MKWNEMKKHEIEKERGTSVVQTLWNIRKKDTKTQMRISKWGKPIKGWQHLLMIKLQSSLGHFFICCENPVFISHGGS